jgi:hypothetical protein
MRAEGKVGYKEAGPAKAWFNNLRRWRKTSPPSFVCETTYSLWSFAWDQIRPWFCSTIIKSSKHCYLLGNYRCHSWGSARIEVVWVLHQSCDCATINMTVTLELGWDLLGSFPEDELKRCDPKTIEAARKANRYKYMSQSATV